MITIQFYGWMIPTVITIACFVYAIFIYDDGGGFMDGLGNLIMCVPASIISMIAWIIYAICK